MSKKSASLVIAAFMLAASAASAFAGGTTHNGRRQMNPYDARASAESRSSTDWPYGAREPFTAAEKRAFQTPTGAEVDRW